MAFLVMLYTYIATFLITELLRPKPNIENAKPAGIGDFQVPTATEGRSVPLIWGRVKMAGPNVVWYGDLKAEPITQEVQTGMFSSEDQIIGYKYSIGMQMALCRGPMSSTDFLYNIRVDDSYAWGESASTADAPISPVDAGTGLSINQPKFFGGDEAGGGGGLIGSMTMFPGTESQDVSSYLAPFQTPLPAYRGTVYLTWNTGEIGLNPNLRPFDFELSRFPDGLDLATLQPGDEIVNDGANCMNVLYEILTSAEWGLNRGVSDINVTSLRAIAATLATEGQGFAWVMDSVKDLDVVVRMIEEQVDGVLFQDPITGVFDFQLIRFDYTPGTLPLLDESNVQKINRFSRPSWASTSNVVNLQFNDRRKNYAVSYALAQDMANVDIVQAVNAVEVKFPAVKEAALANAIAWREQRQLSFPMATGQLVSDRSQFDLKPGDVRELTWGLMGLVRLPIRIIKVNRGRVLDNKITIDFTEDIFAAGAGSFADPIDTSWIPPSDAAFLALDEVLLEVPYRITDENFTGVNTTELQVATIVVRDGGMHVGWKIRALEVDAPGPAASPTISDAIAPGSGVEFSPYGLLTAALDRGQTNGFQDAVGFTVDNTVDLERLANATASELENAKNVALIDDEIILFQTVIDNLDGTFDILDLFRGALDTLPDDHLDNAPVFFGLVNQIPNPDPSRNYQVRNQPFTPFDIVSFPTTPQLGITTVGRAAKAYPPRDVQINPSAPGGGYFPVSAGSPSGAELVGEIALRWHGSDKFLQAFATAWDDGHVLEEAGVFFRVRIIEDPAGAATVVLDDATIVSGALEVAFDASAFADDTITDQYQVEVSTLKNGASQVWIIEDFSIYGYGYKYGEKYGGDNVGVIL